MKEKRKEKKLEKVRVIAIPCEVYSRIVGYFRPVQFWNDGKRQEFEERKEIKLGSEVIKSFREKLESNERLELDDCDVRKTEIIKV